jgi:hypothetical protein
MKANFLIAGLVVVAWASPVLTQQPATTSWELEEIRTSDGRTYRGLIRGEIAGEVEFVEVIRPPSKPMFLVVRPIDAKSISFQRKLSEAKRRKLAERIERFRYRSVIEAGRMEDVALTRVETPRRTAWQYHGSWFSLASTADEETTRRSIVRIEQIFRAYRQLLPPRVRPQRELRVLLFGSLDEYRQHLREHELDISNPAFFAEELNLIVAASDLVEYNSRLTEARQQHQQARAQLAELDADMDWRLAEMRKRLQASDVSKDKIDDEMNARRAAWKVDYEESMRQLAAADRRNEARFANVTEQMFRRLYHEGFHAYLENYVYPSIGHDVPIWLNEGLAQVFQSGQLDGDALRIDAPLASALKIVQDDLRGRDPLSLEQLLLAGRREFLAGPEAGERTAKLYAYAWALAYVLTFNDGLLGSHALNNYVTAKPDQIEPLAAFERLTQAPLAEFEPRWRRDILNLKSP